LFLFEKITFFLFFSFSRVRFPSTLGKKMPHQKRRKGYETEDYLSVCASLCCGLVIIAIFTWIALWPLFVHDDIHHDESSHHHHHDDPHTFAAVQQQQATLAANVQATTAVPPHKNQKTIGPLQEQKNS
jgi:hypothetical protein